LAADCTEARLERSHSMKVHFVEGEILAIWVIREAARVPLRPLKKMWEGFWEASREIDVAPRPVVPVKDMC
jgi:hypothetical protein